MRLYNGRSRWDGCATRICPRREEGRIGCLLHPRPASSPNITSIGTLKWWKRSSTGPPVDTFHFLTDPSERAAYVDRVLRAVRFGGHVIIGTFALDGPERCSGLPVVRYDAAAISEILGPSFDLSESRIHAHHTPAGVIQRFQFSCFRRLN